MELQYFPGGNTGLGFFNLFEGITPPWEQPQRTYVLKGGPGVGKNTLMHRIGEKAVAKGLDVEYFPCASDPDSLDAVRLVQTGIVVVDGTAPHIIDPILPGSADEIINLGVFLNQKALAAQRAALQPLFDANHFEYVLIYAYLSAARALRLATLNTAEALLDMPKVREFLRMLLPECTRSTAYPVPRRLFAGAITPKGVVEFPFVQNGAEKTLCFTGEAGLIFMREAMNMFAGCKTEAFLDPLVPTLPAHLRLREAGLLLTTRSGEGQAVDTAAFSTAPLPDCLHFHTAQIELLTQQAIAHLAHTKGIHDEIETIYKASMDFEGVNKETERLLKELSLD